MEAELKAALASAPGLQAILVSTTDGATLFRATTEEYAEASNPDFEASLAASFGDVESCIGKIGAVSSIATMRSTALFYYIHAAPLVITLVAEPDANLGLLKELEPRLLAMSGMASLRKAAGEVELSA